MKSSAERENRLHYRTALVCFVCIALCIYLDVQKYMRAGSFYLDWSFALSILLYLVLLFLGVRALRKGKKEQEEQAGQKNL